MSNFSLPFARWYLACALMLFSYVGHATGLSGSFTIGGTSPDYATIGAAISALETIGISGPVTFNIRTGTYTEQLTMSSISGVSSTNRIVFQSETGDSTDVEITYTSTSGSDNWTWRLNDADYITFQHLTLTNPANMAASVLRIDSGSSYIEVRHCAFETVYGLGNGSEGAGVYVPNNQKCDYLTITNNRFVHGRCGVYLRSSGSSLIRATGWTVNHNVFVDPKSAGVRMDQCYVANVVGNEVYSSLNCMALDIISIQDSLVVTDNRLVLDSAVQTGIRVVASKVQYGLIANNLVWMDEDLGSTWYAHGMQIGSSGPFTSGSTFDVVHNTVVVNGSDPFSDLVFESLNNITTGTYTVANNLFYGNNAIPLVAMDAASIDVMDYNGFYTSEQLLGYWADTTAVASLQELQQLSGSNLHSVEGPLWFAAPQTPDISIGGVYSNAGSASYSVAADINGAMRSGAPDIGAAEFTGLAGELGLQHIFAPHTCSDTAQLYVVLANTGSTSSTGIAIQWALGGAVQTPVNLSDTLQAGALDTVLLAQLNLSAGSTVDVQAWLSAGGTVTADDTTAVLQVSQALSGSYTVGGSSPDFATISAACAALENGGVCGPVVFNIRPGTYNEQLTLSNVAGTSSANTVVFQSEGLDSSSVIITHAPTADANYVWQLNQCSYITLQHLTLDATGSNYLRCVDLKNFLTHITISHCALISPTIGGIQEAQKVYAEGVDVHHLTIEHNYLSNGNTGLHLWPIDDYPGGFTNVVLRNNTLVNQYERGMLLRSCYAVQILNNHIECGGGIASSQWAGMSLQGSDGPCAVVGNRIHCLDGVRSGIMVSGGNATAANRSLIANNELVVRESMSSGTGIELSGFCEYWDIVHNSIWLREINGAHTNSGGIVTFARYTRVFNNMVVGEASAAFRQVSNSSSFAVEADYNNYYTGGPNLTKEQNTFYDLAGWQALGGNDANSVSIEPNFESSTSLRVNQLNLADLGDGYAAITTDIEGAARDTAAPDLGCYEWTYVPFVCEQATNLQAKRVQDVSARLLWDTVPGATGYNVYLKAAGNPDWDTIFLKEHNHGVWIVNGLQPNTVYRWTVATHCGNQGVWSAPVGPRERFVTLGGPCADPDSLHTDAVTDERARLNWVPATQAWRTVLRWREQGGTWNYELKDATRDRHWLTGLSANTTYEWQARTKCNPDNTSNTAWTATQTFTTEASAKTLWQPTDAASQAAVHVYPNPARNRATVSLQGLQAGQQVHVRLFTATGQLLQLQTISSAQGSTKTTLDLQQLPSGLYWVQVTGATTHTEKLIVQ